MSVLGKTERIAKLSYFSLPLVLTFLYSKNPLSHSVTVLIFMIVTEMKIPRFSLKTFSIRLQLNFLLFYENFLNLYPIYYATR